MADIIAEGLRIVDKLVPDKGAQLQAAQQSDTNQAEINKNEATKENLFIAGWRPACGWLCVAAFALHYFIFPFISYVFCLFDKEITVPDFDMATLNTLLFNLLGLGAFRTIEKVMKK